MKQPFPYPKRFAALTLYCVFCLVLLAARPLLLGDMKHRFLSWNLFLAWVPFAATWLAYYAQRLHTAAAWLMLVIWLLFLPNTWYIATDMIHLIHNSQLYLEQRSVTMEYWYDLILLFQFSLCGLALGYASINQILRFFAHTVIGKHPFLFVTAVSLLSGFGLYLGRIQRLNSWDVLHDPLPVLNSIVQSVTTQHIKLSLLFALFIGSTYFLIRCLASTDQTSKREK